MEPRVKMILGISIAGVSLICGFLVWNWWNNNYSPAALAKQQQLAQQQIALQQQQAEQQCELAQQALQNAKGAIEHQAIVDVSETPTAAARYNQTQLNKTMAASLPTMHLAS